MSSSIPGWKVLLWAAVHDDLKPCRVEFNFPISLYKVPWANELCLNWNFSRPFIYITVPINTLNRYMEAHGEVWDDIPF
jgi:hypothetical protein